MVLTRVSRSDILCVKLSRLEVTSAAACWAQQTLQTAARMREDLGNIVAII